jgi:hypothetical protein
LHTRLDGLGSSFCRREEHTMAQFIAALFEDPGRAEGALQALMTAGLSGQQTSLIRPEAHASEMAPFRESTGGTARLAAVPDADRALFADGIRRGGCVLLADIPGNVEEAIRIVETFAPADLDGRTGGRPENRAAAGPHSGVDVGAPLGAGLTAGMGQGNTNLESMPGAGTMADDTSILGTADLHTSEMSAGDQGRSTIPVGDRRSEERAGAPGVRELRSGSRVRSYGT